MQIFKEISKIIRADKGSVIHRFGDEDTNIYLLVQGKVSIRMRIGTEEMDGPEVTAGQMFGGLGLVRDNDRFIQATATEPVVILASTLKDLNNYRVNHGAEGMTFFQEILEHIHKFSEGLKAFGGAEAANDQGGEALKGFYYDSPYAEVTAPDDEASYIMNKTYVCPVCGTETVSKAIRSTKLKMTDRGNFFMNYFEHIEPLWYSLVTCEHCGYTDRSETFSDEIKYDKAKISAACKEIHDKKSITYSEPRTLEEVINGYMMLKKTMDIRDTPPRVKARGLLIMYEILVRAGFEEEANTFRDKAYEFYKGMFASGILDVNDEQLQQLYIILGKLHEKREEYQDAKNAYRNAKAIKVSDTKFNELAEDFLIDLDEMN